jgi:hypothetical protein
MSAAVLDHHPHAGQLVHVRGRRPARVRRELRQLADVSDLLRYLFASDDVSQLWLTPRWTDAHPLADVDRAWLPVDAGRGPAAIVTPALNRRLREATREASGAELLEALEVYARALGAGLAGSPGQTAEMLLRGVLARRRALEPLRELPALPIVTEPVLSWIRPLLPDEAELPWLLAIDRRGAYLHSMALCDLGIGEPVLLERPDWRELLWTPGYYLAKLAPWRELILPDPVRCARVGEQIWLTMPALRLAAALGLVLEVECAWVWRRRSRVLKSIAERIARARGELEATEGRAAAIARSLLKRTYTELVGRLRMEAHRGTPLYRPDWHAAIVADARARVFRGGLELARCELAPAACAIDCWYVLAATPELPPALEAQHWRLSAAVPTARVDLAVFDDASVVELQSRIREATR